MRPCSRFGLLRLIFITVSLPSGLAGAQRQALRAGLVITHSTSITPNVYRLRAPASLDSPLVVVRGDDVTVDLRGVTLRGTAEAAAPDESRGVAILVDGGRNVTIRGGRILGYQVAIRARGTRHLVLIDNDLSHNWRPRLYSVLEHESLVDWLSFHHNEQNEWLRFGAAMYLEGVRGGEIRDNIVSQGMNALLMTRSDSMLVWNNDFSFNSGLGVGLYRSSDNRIMHNRIDYDVRGHSEGYYHRGQDSAGILVYEQSCRNVIAYNSVTHGGDGLFLWAGQSTMDTGEGGANDNVVYQNDFSFAPANGIEATFSRNVFARNRVVGSDYGVWGGYSFDSWIVDNTLLYNRTGIAIEHGQGNRIVANTLTGDTTGVRLWADSIEPSDWGYPKHRDTRSRDNVIDGNRFARNRVGVRASNSGMLTMRGNRFAETDTEVVSSSTTVVRGDSGAAMPDELRRRLPARLPNGHETRSPVAALPRAAIIVDEWGPYDWRTPKLWPVDSVRAVPPRLAVLGPRGWWTVQGTRNVSALSKRAGRVTAVGMTDTITVTPRAGSFGDWAVTLAFRRAPEAPPDVVSYDRFEPAIDWTERVFAWSDSTDPRTRPDAFAALVRGTPLLERHVPRLDLMWYRPTVPGIPSTQWALAATGTADLPAGAYTLQTISDDAIRVWVDDALVIDDWTPHESRVDVAPLGGGHHQLRVQYLQVDGWVEQRLEILRGPPPMSGGSPGPH
ncbi:MAG TPA: right-handed parallel beta-helix repeat-containing protein [Gemmatimonadaceae bacterium]